MNNLFGNVAKDFSQYRSGYPNKFYKKLEDNYNVVFQNKKVLDIATSNGLAARDLVSRGCFVTGLDNSPELIDEAKKTNDIQKLNIDYVIGDVTKLPFSDNSFDIVTAIHCWNVLPSTETSKEVLRVLKDGGKFIIAQFDQLSMKHNIVFETDKLVSKYNSASGQMNSYVLFPQWIEEFYNVGFSNIETFTFDITNFFTPDEWRGRMRTAADIGGSLTREKVLAFDKDLASHLEKHYSGEVLEVPHRMLSIVCEKCP